MPTTLTFQGAWVASTHYVINDAVYSGATVYVCTANHIASAENAPPDDDFWETAAPTVVGTSYASVEDYLQAAGNSDDSDSTTIARQLSACSRLFDSEAGQWFGLDASPTARIYIGKYPDYLDVDIEGCPGIGNVSGLTVHVDRNENGTYSEVWAPTDYELWPRNATPEPTPYTRLVVPSWSTKTFPVGSEYGKARGRVKVTARFGWPQVPEAVRADVIELCRIWRTESPRATGRIDELGQLVNDSPLARSLVSRFRSAYTSRITF